MQDKFQCTCRPRPANVYSINGAVFFTSMYLAMWSDTVDDCIVIVDWVFSTVASIEATPTTVPSFRSRLMPVLHLDIDSLL